ncbi:hypothetical protein V6N11_050477 [Hibiscus sabdariffa]|uniref:Uncharacterized protein n=2 Tax=Hibiscus sabdariffa TaxID=183260 RepID=A0ABR2BY68_9ROSI
MDPELARLNELMRESTVAMNNLLHADMSWQYSPQQELSNSKGDELARLEALVREATHDMDSLRQQSTHWDTEVLMQETSATQNAKAKLDALEESNRQTRD